MKLRRLLLSALILLGVLSVEAQHSIKVKVNGISDTTLMIGHHFGPKKYVVDTAQIDEKGWALFEGDENLEKGIYLLVMPSRGMTFFEFIVGDNMEFSLETDTSNYVEEMKIKGCKENVVFNNYQREMAVLNRERMKLDELMKSHSENVDSVELIKADIIENAKERQNSMLDIINSNPDSFFSKVLNSMVDLDIPEPPKDEEGNIIDSSFQYRFYKDHYFDNIDFSESGLLRTPIFEGKLNYFFKSVVAPIPDSLIIESNKVITNAFESGDSLMFRFVTGHLINYFETSKVMGFDKVFVNIAEDWYLNGKAYWADSTFLTKLKERVMKISPNIIGNIAPNLEKMGTFDNQFMSLHLVDADYTILVFYEPDCGHCKVEVPKLFKTFEDTLSKENVKVFCLYTQYEKEKWGEFIEEKDLIHSGWYNVWDGPYPHTNFRNFYDIYSTPVVFILDKEKRIIAKRINVDSITDFLKYHREFSESEKNTSE